MKKEIIKLLKKLGIIATPILVTTGCANQDVNENMATKAEIEMPSEDNENKTINIESTSVEKVKTLEETLAEKYNAIVASTEEKLVEYYDNSSALVNNLLSTGFMIDTTEEMTDEDKKIYAQVAFDYIKLMNDSDFTFEENMPIYVGENTVQKQFENMFLVNDHILKTFLIATEETNVDFSLVFKNEKDVELLNELQNLFIKLNATKKNSEFKEVDQELYDFYLNTCVNEKNNAVYSDQAMFLISQSYQSYIQLTKKSNDEISSLGEQIVTIDGECNDFTRLQEEGTLIYVNANDKAESSKLVFFSTYYPVIENTNTIFKLDTIIDGIDFSNYVDVESYDEKMQRIIAEQNAREAAEREAALVVEIPGVNGGEPVAIQGAEGQTLEQYEETQKAIIDAEVNKVEIITLTEAEIASINEQAQAYSNTVLQQSYEANPDLTPEAAAQIATDAFNSKYNELYNAAMAAKTIGSVDLYINTNGDSLYCINDINGEPKQLTYFC